MGEAPVWELAIPCHLCRNLVLAWEDLVVAWEDLVVAWEDLVVAWEERG